MMIKHGGAAARFGYYLLVDCGNFARRRRLYASYKHKNSPNLAPNFPSLIMMTEEGSSVEFPRVENNK